MKKIICYLLFLVIAIGIAGCSSDTENQAGDAPSSSSEITSETKIDTFEVGEVATNESIEFTLEKVDYGKCLSNVNDDNFLLTEGAVNGPKNPFCAEEEKVMVSFCYTIKNTGKEKLDIVTWSFDLIYDDYVFSSEELDNYYYLEDGIWKDYQNGRYIDPLSSKKYRAYMEVPAEVFENTNIPLNFKLYAYVPTEDKQNYDKILGEIYLQE